MPTMKLKGFAKLMLNVCPILNAYFTDMENDLARFQNYKNVIPVRGAIILNKKMTKVLMVKGWKTGASWGFPRGKINKDEPDEACAVREVYEEIGFDIKPFIVSEDYIEVCIKEKNIRLYVVRGISGSTVFEPQTRKEISKIEWHDVRSLPSYSKGGASSTGSSYFMVTPFVPGILKYIAKQRGLPNSLSKSEARALKNLLGVKQKAVTAKGKPPQTPAGQNVILSEDNDQAAAELLSLLKASSAGQAASSEDIESPSDRKILLDLLNKNKTSGQSSDAHDLESAREILSLLKTEIVQSNDKDQLENYNVKGFSQPLPYAFNGYPPPPPNGFGYYNPVFGPPGQIPGAGLPGPIPMNQFNLAPLAPAPLPWNVADSQTSQNSSSFNEKPSQPSQVLLALLKKKAMSPSTPRPETPAFQPQPLAPPQKSPSSGQSISMSELFNKPAQREVSSGMQLLSLLKGPNSEKERTTRPQVQDAKVPQTHTSEAQAPKDTDSTSSLLQVLRAQSQAPEALQAPPASENENSNGQSLMYLLNRPQQTQTQTPSTYSNPIEEIISAPPVSAPPISAPPVSAPAVPAPPVSAPPVSAPPISPSASSKYSLLDLLRPKNVPVSPTVSSTITPASHTVTQQGSTSVTESGNSLLDLLRSGPKEESPLPSLGVFDKHTIPPSRKGSFDPFAPESRKPSTGTPIQLSDLFQNHSPNITSPGLAASGTLSSPGLAASSTASLDLLSLLRGSTPNNNVSTPNSNVGAPNNNVSTPNNNVSAPEEPKFSDVPKKEEEAVLGRSLLSLLDSSKTDDEAELSRSKEINDGNRLEKKERKLEMRTPRPIIPPRADKLSVPQPDVKAVKSSKGDGQNISTDIETKTIITTEPSSKLSEEDRKNFLRFLKDYSSGKI